MTHKKVFIASDIHYPFHHKPSVEIAKKVCKDVKPDYFGDLYTKLP